MKFYAASIVGASLLTLISLSGGGKPPAPQPQEEGELLAQQYCQSCHLLPSPDHLDQETWLTKVFPIMRTYLGMDPMEDREIMPHDLQALYPEFPKMTEDEWFTVVQWYLDNAPAQLPFSAVPEVDSSTPLFREHALDRPVVPVMSSMVRLDTVGHRLIVGDGTTNAIWVYGLDGVLRDSVPLTGPPSSAIIDGPTWYVTDMGNLFPHDTAIGAVKRIDWTPNGPTVTDVLAPVLRPTDVQVVDLNGDGRKDYLLCEFGNRIGQFGWYDVPPKGKPIYHALVPRPGAIRSRLADLNNDGRIDILVQMAQAREGIYGFINKGKGQFDMIDLAIFPPSFGSSNFTLADWNADGKMDLIVTTGDNGDYEKPPFKPYHGTRVFVNNGDLTFTETLMIPFDGAYGAYLGDFDLDGSADLFTHAYFSRLSLGNAAMVRYHRDVKGANHVSTIPQALSGRWLVSDCADVDGDGDLDILLGNVSYGPGAVSEAESERWINGGRLAVYLENLAR